MTVNISGTTGIDTVNNTALVSKTIQSPIFTGSPVITSAGGGLITLTPVSTASNFTLTVPAKTSTIDTLARTGNVLQVVNANLTSLQTTTSSSWVSAGLTASITPSSTSSKIYILFNGAMSGALGTNNVFVTVFRGTIGGVNLGNTSYEFANLYVNSATQVDASASLSYVDSPSTISSVTYTIAFRTTTGQGAISNNSETSTITLMEIAG